MPNSKSITPDVTNPVDRGKSQKEGEEEVCQHRTTTRKLVTKANKQRENQINDSSVERKKVKFKWLGSDA